jgi:hypothetical protein
VERQQPGRRDSSHTQHGIDSNTEKVLKRGRHTLQFELGSTQLPIRTHPAAKDDTDEEQSTSASGDQHPIIDIRGNEASVQSNQHVTQCAQGLRHRVNATGGAQREHRVHKATTSSLTQHLEERVSGLPPAPHRDTTLAKRSLDVELDKHHVLTGTLLLEPENVTEEVRPLGQPST